MRETDKMAAMFEQRFRPVTVRITRMILAPHSANRDSYKPTKQEFDQQLVEIRRRVLPQLELLLKGRQFFCGDELTIIDIQIYCELTTVSELLEEKLIDGQNLPNLHSWMGLLDLTAALKDER